MTRKHGGGFGTQSGRHVGAGFTSKRERSNRLSNPHKISWSENGRKMLAVGKTSLSALYGFKNRMKKIAFRDGILWGLPISGGGPVVAKVTFEGEEMSPEFILDALIFFKHYNDKKAKDSVERIARLDAELRAMK